MRKLFVCLLLISLSVLSSNLIAAETTLFGPHTYTRTTASSDVFTDTFTASAVSGRLVVRNGSETGEHKVTSATITINGVEVFSTEDFQQGGYLLERTVDLTDANTLAVELTGDPESRLEIEILQPVSSITAFGPQNFERTTGATTVYNSTFSAVNVEGRLIIHNGSDAGGHRVTSGTITLNGVKIFSTNDFKQGTFLLERAVNLAETNQLVVELSSKPGTWLDIEVIHEDVFPKAALHITPGEIIQGKKATLSWTTVRAETMTIEPGIGQVDPNGSMEITPQASTTYTITATNDYGTATESATITVIPLPVITVASATANITWGESCELSWQSVHADTVTIDNGVGAVAPTGTVTVSPTQTTVYTLTAAGPGGEATATITVNVLIPEPIVTLTAAPDSILQGASATLSWTSAYAQTLTIDNGPGSLLASGSMTVNPTQTTTYTITAIGPGGTTTASATVTVIPKPVITVASDTINITWGDACQLAWQSVHADIVTIDNGVGAVAPTGSVTVSPTTTTVYTLTAAGPGGEATATITVNVLIPEPTVTLTAVPAAIIQGESATLSWTSAFAQTLTIDNGPGSLPASGSMTVNPMQTTTYTITAIGPGGTVTASATVAVLYPPAITIIEPDGVDDTVDELLPIVWTDDDPDSNAVISLYYDTDNTGEDGTLIIGGITEDPDGALDDLFVWDTTAVSQGIYYIYAIIDDGKTSPVTAYSLGPVTISHNTPPAVAITSVVSTQGRLEGYDYLDSRNPGGPVYNWVDIVAVGTKVTLADNSAVVVNLPLPFIFPFYGVNKNNLRISSNGFLTFDSGATEAANRAIPTSTIPNDFIAPFWDDLDPSKGGTVHHYYNSAQNYFVVQYTNIKPQAGSGSDTFQVILYPDGKILFQYKQMQNTLTTATVGVENATGTNGLQIAYNAAFIQNQTALLIVPTPTEARITWEDSDPDDNALISLYYDTDNTGGNGTLIAENISEDADGAGGQYTWKTAAIPEGTYYIYAKISDSINPPVINYIQEPMTIDRHTPRFTPLGDAATEQGQALTFKVSAWDPNKDPLTYAAVDLPTGATFTPATRTFAWTPAADQAGDFYPQFTASDGTYSAAMTVKITVGSHAPVVTLTTDMTAVPRGGSANLSWTSTYATACSISPSVGSVPVNGSAPVSPAETTTYTITATGPGGTATADVTITVADPQVSLSVTPTTIRSDGVVYLTWTSSYAATCSISPGVGNVALNGSMAVYPAASTTYTITAAASGVTATDSVAITVNQRPRIRMSLSKEVINYGESVTLTWSAAPAQTACFNNNIGAAATSGSMVLTPAYTTTYGLTAVNTTPSDTVTDYQTIAVKVLNHPPALQPEGSFGEQYNDIIPPDASLESYDPERFIVVTGLVQDINGNPLPGVTATLLNHPEYGSVQTDETGRYAIPAEGGCLVKVSLEKEAYLTSQRQTVAGVKDVVAMETVTMITRDPAATVVSFDGDPGTVISHQSTPVSDEFGARACTLVFAGDNKAYSLDPYGNVVEQLPSITVRATEYATPASMPAVLPPTSAYTYCVEMEADGYDRIRFEKPATCFVDNFIGFDVGVVVPVGYYDRRRAVWEPSDNGVVVKLLDTDADGLIDSLDATGDNLPDDLDKDGLKTDETAGLDTDAYLPGDTCWRISINHFCPIDGNWAYDIPGGSTGPNPDGTASASSGGGGPGGVGGGGGSGSGGDGGGPSPSGCPKASTNVGSFVEDRSQVLHDDKPVFGTGLELHYAADRTDGFKTKIVVPASGDTVPDNLKRITVEVDIAGRTLSTKLNPLPDQKAEFAWDGLDYRGNKFNRVALAHVRVGFAYDAVYTLTPPGVPKVFAQPGFTVTYNRARPEVTLWKNDTIEVSAAQVQTDPAGAIADGWTLSAHHYFNFNHQNGKTVLRKGNGLSVEQNVSSVISLIAGTGVSGTATNDGGQATETNLRAPLDVVADAEGNIYFSDDANYRLRKVDRDGVISTLGQGFEWSGASMAMDAAGNIYIAGNRTEMVHKVDVNGKITRFAGTGYPWSGGDGGPASQAGIVSASGVAVDWENNVYIADSEGHRVRKVDPNGIISTVAGKGTFDYYQDNIPALEAFISPLIAVAADAYGNIYISTGNRIRKVGTNGIITTVAGTGQSGYNGDGGPATAAKLGNVWDLAVDAWGNLYLADITYDCIRKINTSGIITTIAGRGSVDYTANGELATDIKFTNPGGICLDPRGGLMISDKALLRVFKSGPPALFAGAMTNNEVLFPDINGMGYIMDNAGRHEITVDLETGAVLSEHLYDLFAGKKRLTAIRDQFNNQVTINRYADGTPYSIVSPDGVTTRLTIDSDNHLTRITGPDNSFCDFTYTDDGLMTGKKYPNGNTYQYLYDNIGRITDTHDQEGGHWQFDKTFDSDGTAVSTVTSAEGNTTIYQDTTDSTGRVFSTITGPSGSQSDFTQSANGLAVHKQTACGMTVDYAYGLDPVYKNIFSKQMTEATASNLTRTSAESRQYLDTNYDDIPDRITRTMTVNGKSATIENNTLTSVRTLVSPEGRELVSAYDPATMAVTHSELPGLNGTDFAYFADGKLSTVATGSRQTAFAYDARGYLASVTDPRHMTTGFTNDAMGRVTRVDRPDGSSLGFSYDANGNMTVLTNPSDVDHSFAYNHVDLAGSYTTPLSGSYSYVYDKDRRLIQKNFPSGRAISFDYENPADPGDKSRLWRISTPERDIDYTYLCGEKVGSVSSGSESITYTYDGKLVTSETLAGTLNKSLGYTWNTDFDLALFTYAGATESYAYDDDGLLTNAGSFAISRYNDPGANETGLPYNVSNGVLSLNRTFNGYGETGGEDHQVNGQDVYSWGVADRYADGRIKTKTETIGGVTVSYDYSYDALGRLLSVVKDGTLAEEYAYDNVPYGTCTYQVNTLRGISGRELSYDSEDRLLSSGGTEYTYDADGFLTSKSTATETTGYDYSSRGELLGVNLPDGKAIQYVHDPLGRRIAKKVNGTITEKYLWSGLTTLLAVYDGSDNLIMRFRYADGRMPVAVEKAGATYYLAYDQVGTPRAVADSAGNIVKQVEYDSFGFVINDSNPGFEIPFGFAGGLYDRDTGLVRFGYRDYDPDTGRWTAKDPIGFNGGDSDLYGYCLGDGVNLADPNGLDAGAAALSGAAVAGEAAGVAVLSGAAVVYAGVGAYAITSQAIEGTYLDGELGSDVYDVFHPPTSEMGKGERGYTGPGDRNANPDKHKRYNPRTGRWEKKDPHTGKWKPTTPPKDGSTSEMCP